MHRVALLQIPAMPSPIVFLGVAESKVTSNLVLVGTHHDRMNVSCPYGLLLEDFWQKSKPFSKLPVSKQVKPNRPEDVMGGDPICWLFSGSVDSGPSFLNNLSNVASMRAGSMSE